MRDITLNSRTADGKIIVIGRRGENLACRIVFDYTDWKTLVGDGVVTAFVKRNGDSYPYPAILDTVDDNNVALDLTSTETAIVGAGKIEFFYVVNEAVAKSAVINTVVMEDIGVDSLTPPDPYDDWMDDLAQVEARTLENAETAQQAMVDAQTAQAGAEAAQVLAETAQGKAETAQGKAEDAQAEAERFAGQAQTAEAGAEAARDSILNMTATAEITNNATGTPSVVVTKSTVGDHENLDFAFSYMKGQKGDKGNTGDAAGFGSVSATVDENVGTPSVEVTESGPNTAKNFAFAFHNLKGEQGETGNGIESIEKTDTQTVDGREVDTYTITYTDESTETYEVTNGKDGEVTAEELEADLIDKADVIVSHAEGSIASFSDGGDDLAVKKLEVEIVPKQDLLPSGYKAVEYIKSSGAQYVDTGFKPFNGWGFDVKFKSSNANSGTQGYGAIFGSRTSSGTNDYQLTTYSSGDLVGTFRNGRGTGEYFCDGGLPEPNTLSVAKFLNGVYTAPNGSTTSVSFIGTPAYNIYAFALNQAGESIQPGTVELYYLRFYNGSTMVKNFIPVMRLSDNKYGLFDLIAQEFKEMQNGEPYAHGSDVSVPNPNAICPITGSDGVTVKRTGKNLLKYPYSASSDTINGVTYTVNSDGTVTLVSGTATAEVAITLQSASNLSHLIGHEVTLSGTPSGGSATTYWLQWYLSTDNRTSVEYGSGVTFTPTLTTGNIAIRVKNGYTIPTGGLVFKPMIRMASIAGDTYEPYTSDSLSTQFGSTVYGGEVDLVSGVLRVTDGFKTLNGSESWSAHGSIASWFYLDSVFDDSYVDITAKDFAISNKYVQNAYNLAAAYENGEFGIGLPTGGSHNRIVIKDTAYSTVAQFQTALGSTPVQVAYRLATPTEVQLTPSQLSTLLGSNNIWADTGDVSVDYRADTKLYIDGKLAELIAQIVNS